MKCIAFLLFALSLCGVAPSGAARDIDQDEVLKLRQEGKVLPFQQILHAALAKHANAQILEVELDEEDGLFHYELEILTEPGVVRELKIDAHTGKVLEDERED